MKKIKEKLNSIVSTIVNILTNTVLPIYSSFGFLFEFLPNTWEEKFKKGEEWLAKVGKTAQDVKEKIEGWN